MDLSLIPLNADSRGLGLLPSFFRPATLSLGGEVLRRWGFIVAHLGLVALTGDLITGAHASLWSMKIFASAEVETVWVNGVSPPGQVHKNCLAI
ncbi:hypothetical protein GQ53DRAFT_752544 [Thozetella sp. PMI_491]|nr:hypothetical protein GQ53DRAFT_752544 [Thozetella sp. PMI_491]